MTARIQPVDPRNPDPEIIDRAAGILRSGGLVVFPTSGLYGLAADAQNPAAVRKVFAAKQRPEGMPLSVLIEGPEMLCRLAATVPEKARMLMDRFWPGALTIVLPAAAHLPVELTANTGTIAVRVPAHSTAMALVKAFAGPFTATSANLSGAPGVFQIADLAPVLLDKADLVLDGGRLLGGAGSTVVDATADPPVMLREGAVSAADIDAALKGAGP